MGRRVNWSVGMGRGCHGTLVPFEKEMHSYTGYRAYRENVNHIGLMPSVLLSQSRLTITLPLCSQYSRPISRSFFLARGSPRFARFKMTSF